MRYVNPEDIQSLSPKDPGSPENGFMEPKYMKYFAGEVIGHPLLIIWEKDQPPGSPEMEPEKTCLRNTPQMVVTGSRKIGIW